MQQRTIILIIGLFIIVVVGMFSFAFMKRAEIANTPEPEVQNNATTTPYDYIERVDAKHFFIDGTHTLVGEILMPTPCDLLESDSRVAESYPEQVTVAFTVINNAEMCAEVMTAQRFMTSFSASQDARISATLMGRNVELNLIPAAEGESPEDFELYIKG